MQDLIMATSIVAITIVFVSGEYVATHPVLGWGGLALGTGWLSILQAGLIRLVREGHYANTHDV